MAPWNLTKAETLEIEKFFGKVIKTMSAKDDMGNQTKRAFDFIQKLYFEVSYLVKEIEGLLQEEPEKFVIGKPAGYGISSRKSTSLESVNIPYWLPGRFAVFFVPQDKIRPSGRGTKTGVDNTLKVLYFRFILDDKEPLVYAGLLHDIEPRKNELQSFEKVIGHLVWYDEKVFQNPLKTVYEDNSVKFKGEFKKSRLFTINTSEEVRSKLLQPILELFRQSQP